MNPKCKTYNRKKIVLVFLVCFLAMGGLAARLVYLMIFESEYYQELAQDLHERERSIKAARGRIVDSTGTVLATNRTVCTISVVHSQIEDPERVIEVLSSELGIPEETVREKVEKYSSIERIRSNVEKEVGDRIRAYELAGVKVDEDFKRYYPYGSLASKVLGFTGSDNQGIIGLEVVYDEYLQGIDGTILTETDARGVEIADAGEERVEPVSGSDLYVSLDYNIQLYAQQAALKALEEKQATYVSILVMNPKNGEIYACVNVPEFDLNDPFTLNTGVDTSGMTSQEKQDLLNQMWRNQSVNDTYEPGSTFKTVTAAAALEKGVVSLTDTFSCPGFRMVEDRRIRCHKVGGHGTETFVQAIMNSCNPVFIDIGQRIGVEDFYHYFQQFGLMSKTGIDIPGEAGTIMHKMENIGAVELATISFGQSFQITPIQLATTISSIINGGTRVTPHFGVEIRSSEGELLKRFRYETKEGIVSEETSETMRYLLEKVVSEGGGNKAYIEGYRIGGKTATSQTLPRGTNKYISSFVGFAPADDPEVLAMCIIHNPQGVYYGGTIAAPVIRDIFENILPYLGIEKTEVVSDPGEPAA
ncbi:peptidoglycan glycosyltransferase [Lachnoclostridium sp. An131]|uniref:peptidoglycan D,D-transpeptidase FtsI family protein n=1 Tax=Lachnoclostridium sp. An131 TaxID=1965555 RepID=UPI000B381E0F|nr:penicillin-binding transpeptidase domain-containing protein [Lachnoclostridium sp. An131]OUQ25358.1 peptidoglycan glycosyltransferase [Lachnoclostridium sp. An131]